MTSNVSRPTEDEALRRIAMCQRYGLELTETEQRVLFADTAWLSSHPSADSEVFDAERAAFVSRFSFVTGRSLQDILTRVDRVCQLRAEYDLPPLTRSVGLLEVLP
jgi:hypothetical protein